jgi:hypothetical protein
MYTLAGLGRQLIQVACLSELAEKENWYCKLTKCKLNFKLAGHWDS